jgi:phage/plasmid-associated DNA primase
METATQTEANTEALITRLVLMPPRTKNEVTYESLFPSVVWKNMVGKPTHVSVARVFYELNRTRFRYCRKTKDWYTVDEFNVFRCRRDNIDLVARFGDIVEKLDIYERYLRNKTRYDTEDEMPKEEAPWPEDETSEEKTAREAKEAAHEKEIQDVVDKKLKKTLARLVKLKYDLEDVLYQQKVITAARGFFVDSQAPDGDLTRLLNQDLHLFPFTDKVVDLDSGVVRDIRESDYIATTTGYPYPRRVSEEARALIDGFVNSLQPTPEDVRFTLQLFAACLHGEKSRHHDLTLINLTGSGSNGKSLLTALALRAFGDLGSPMNIEYFTSKRGSSSGATPELANKAHCRLVVACETDPGEVFNSAKIKELTDPMETRQLFKDPVRFRSQFKVVLSTNHDAKFSDCGHGTFRRFLAQPFPFTFCRNPKAENDRPADELLEGKLKTEEARDSFIILLLDTYGRFLKGGQELRVPEASFRYIDEVKAANDSVAQYLDQAYVLTRDVHDKVSKEDLRKGYEIFAGKKIDDNILGKRVIKYTNMPVTKRNPPVYLGLKIRSCAEDIEENRFLD